MALACQTSAAHSHSPNWQRRARALRWPYPCPCAGMVCRSSRPCEGTGRCPHITAGGALASAVRYEQIAPQLFCARVPARRRGWGPASRAQSPGPGAGGLPPLFYWRLTFGWVRRRRRCRNVAAIRRPAGRRRSARAWRPRTAPTSSPTSVSAPFLGFFFGLAVIASTRLLEMLEIVGGWSAPASCCASSQARPLVAHAIAHGMPPAALGRFSRPTARRKAGGAGRPPSPLP